MVMLPEYEYLFNINTDKIISRATLNDHLLTRDTGLILVRPEMFHAYKLVEDFLSASASGINQINIWSLLLIR